MSRRLFIGKPKREGRFQDFPLVNLGGMSVSNWVEILPVVNEDRRENTYTDKISDRKAEIAKRRAEIISKLARLDCIRSALSKMNGDEIILPIEKTELVIDHNQVEMFNQIIEAPIEASTVDLFETEINPVEIEVVQKKESIWSRVKKRTSDLYYKAGMYVGRVMLAAGDLSAGKMMAKPEMKQGENLAEYERRVQRIGMAKVVGLTVLSSVAVHGLKDIFDTTSNNYSTASGHVDHTLIDNALSNQHVVVNTETVPVFSFDAYNVTPGEGLFDTMNQMGITDVGKQYDILQKVGPELQNMDLVYPIDGGSWGISSPGQLPKDALDLIWNCSKNI